MFSIELSKKLSYYLRIELENKIRKLQTELGDNTFDRVDFNKYSFEELEKLELELTYRKRAEDVKDGKRGWWEAIAVQGRLRGKYLNKDFYRKSNKENEAFLSKKLTNYYLNNLTKLTPKEIEENKKHNQKIVKSIVLKIDDYISKKTNILLHSSPQCNFVEEVTIANGMVIIDMTFSMKFGELNIRKFKKDIESNVLKHSVYSVEKDDNEKVRICILLNSLEGIREDGIFPVELEVFAEFMNSLKDKNKLEFVLGVDNKGDLVICLDELRTPLWTKDDEWCREICSLIGNIISEGPSVGVYTVGIGFGPTNHSKPLYLKGINNAICFQLPTHDAVCLNSIEMKLLGFDDRGVALCDIIIEETKSLSVANPGEEVLVKTLRMDDKVLEAINSKL